jgi:hypothetical protein
MRRPSAILITLTLLSGTLAAEEPSGGKSGQSYTIRVQRQDERDANSYLGTIVNGNCSHAKDPKQAKHAPESRKKSILRHCRTNASTTTFALLTDDGKYWSLDETGNNAVIGSWTPTTAHFVSPSGKITYRAMRASVTGTLKDNTLNVQSLSKF